MAVLSAKHLAGPGYIILNVLRGMNIIALGAVVASSVVMLVKTFVVSKFFFFDATSHVITAIAGLFLIISECSLFRTWFARNWPLLSPSHGFVALGMAMMVLGLNLLGNMNKEATSKNSLTMPFWRLLLASGVLSVVIGLFNIVASFVFRDVSRHITARAVRARGAMTFSEDIETASSTYDPKHKVLTISTHHTGSTRSNLTKHSSPTMHHATPRVDCGSPQLASPAEHNQASNKLSQFDFTSPIRSKFRSILPSYHSTSPATHNASKMPGEPAKKRFWQRQREEQEEEAHNVPDISYPLNVNPQFAHLVRPNLAHHPSVRRPEVDYENKI